MQIERASSEALSITRLPDGSFVIVDSGHETVLALNAAAGAAWDACAEPTTLSRVTESMRRTLSANTTDEIAWEAIRQLQEQKLVTTSQPIEPSSRRRFLMQMGAAAVPLVVALPLADQRAYAQTARSAPPPPPPPKTPPKTPPPPPKPLPPLKLP